MEQNKTKGTNKKMLIALTTLCVAFLFVCGAMIGVFAATQQAVNTSFNVSYNVGEHIAATVTASYKTVKDTTGKSEERSFLASDAENSVEAMALGDVVLTPDDATVTFTYTFRNDGQVPFTATLTDTCNAENVTIVYTAPEAEAVTVNAAELTGDETVAPALTGTDIVSVEVPADGSVVTVTVAVTVANTNGDSAVYKTGESNGITWVLKENQP